MIVSVVINTVWRNMFSHKFVNYIKCKMLQQYYNIPQDTFDFHRSKFKGGSKYMPVLLSITKQFSWEFGGVWDSREHEPDLEILKLKTCLSLIVRLWPGSPCRRLVVVCFCYKVVSSVFPLELHWTGICSFALCFPCDFHLDCTVV